MLFALSFPPDVGGGEGYNFDLAYNLALNGQNVHVITPVPEGKEGNYNFKVIRTGPSPMATLLQIIFNVKIIKPDIFHISGPTPIDYILLPLLKFMKIPVVMTYHADFPSRIGRALNSLIFLFQCCVGRIIVQTNTDMKKLIKRGVRSKKLVKFYFNGINPNIYQNTSHDAPRDIDILFIGRMDKAHSYKGYFEVLNIFVLMKNNPRLQPIIYVVGGGEDMPSFSNKAKEKGLLLKFSENIGNDELISILNRSKTLILPSISDAEGFGRVVLEAVFCGVVPIVSKYAGSSEIVDKFNCGIIIDPFDAEDSAMKITALISSETNLKNMQKNGLDMAKNGGFDLASTVRKTVDVYREVLTIDNIKF